jgi:hypothetical protein
VVLVLLPDTGMTETRILACLGASMRVLVMPPRLRLGPKNGRSGLPWGCTVLACYYPRRTRHAGCGHPCGRCASAISNCYVRNIVVAGKLPTKAIHISNVTITAAPLVPFPICLTRKAGDLRAKRWHLRRTCGGT